MERHDVTAALAESLDRWLKSADEAQPAAEALTALLSAVPLADWPAVLKQVRPKTHWTVRGYRDWTPADFRSALRRAVAHTRPADRCLPLCAALAHRSGFIRALAARLLAGFSGPAVTTALAFAADDHADAVRRAATPTLLAAPAGELALQGVRILRCAPDDARRGWREAAIKRLDTPEGHAALVAAAVTIEGPPAVAALDLLEKLGITLPLPALAAAASWRVRRRAAVFAAQQADIALCTQLLTDPMVPVRRAVVWHACFLAPTPRAAIMTAALTDASIRVLRIAVPYTRDTPQARALIEAGLASPLVRERIRGLRLALQADGKAAVPHAVALLTSPDPLLRKGACRALSESEQLTVAHLRLLRDETDPTVAYVAARCAARRNTLAPALPMLLASPVLDRHPGVTSLALRMSVWDALPVVLRALGEDWPGTDNTADQLLRTLRQRLVTGWQRPGAHQRAAIAAALAEHGPRVGHRGLVAAAQGLVDGG